MILDTNQPATGAYFAPKVGQTAMSKVMLLKDKEG